MNDSPLHACAAEYWTSLVDHHERIKTGWMIPTSWNECSKETKSTTLLRIYDHIIHHDITEPVEHHAWVNLKFNAGYHFGEYNNQGPVKSHPMLRPFSDCPLWFQDITGIFCSTVRLWRPKLIEYMDELFEKGFDLK